MRFQQQVHERNFLCEGFGYALIMLGQGSFDMAKDFFIGLKASGKVYVLYDMYTVSSAYVQKHVYQEGR